MERDSKKVAVEEKQSDMVPFTYERLKDENAPSDGKERVTEEWSVNHCRVLYLISKYAQCATMINRKESWIRQLPLNVMLYEGIVAGVLDFDYAPSIMLVSALGVSRRIWMNISQEAKSAVDDLREKKLVHSLKLTSVDFQPVTAFQVSELGLKFLRQIPKMHKVTVDQFVDVPGGKYPETLIVRFKPGIGFSMIDEYEEVVEEHGIDLLNDPDALEKMEKWEREQKKMKEERRLREVNERTAEEGNDRGSFWLIGKRNRYKRESKVTETEDVSYVSSPYLPQCVRNPRDFKPFTSNANRAHESAQGQNTIQDELDIVLVLSYVRCIVGEWLPFGSKLSYSYSNYVLLPYLYFPCRGLEAELLEEEQNDTWANPS